MVSTNSALRHRQASNPATREQSADLECKDA